MNLQASLSQVYQFLREKRFVDAELILRHILEMRPNDGKVGALLAQSLLRQNRIAEAIECADIVLGQENNPDALAIKGMALIESGRTAEGADYIDISLTQRENNYYRSMLVQAFLKLKKAAEARKHLDLLLLNDPGNPYNHRLLSRVLAVEGKTEQAANVLATDSDQPNDFDFAQVIRLKLKKKSPAQAVRDICMLQSLPQHADNPHLKTLLGEYYVRLGSYEEAEQAFMEARNASPNSSYVRQQLGFLYAKMKRFDNVIDLLSPLFLEKPADVILRTTLVKAFEQLGHYDELAMILDQALLKHPHVKQLYGLLIKARRSQSRSENSQRLSNRQDKP